MIVSISGYAGAGKDTAGLIIQRSLGLPIRRWSDKLKQVASVLLGVPPELFENRDFKDSYLPSDWDVPKYAVQGSVVYVDKVERLTVREFLQALGDGMRVVMGDDIWINALLADQKDDMIITDTRYMNEAQVVKNLGGVCIRINRGEPANDHRSETEMDNWSYDYVIDNVSTISNMEHELLLICEKLKNS